MAKYRKDEIPQLCRNCKWWGDGTIFGLEEGEGYKTFKDADWCGSEFINSNINDRDINNDMALSYETIYTQPNFGCIHWEGK